MNLLTDKLAQDARRLIEAISPQSTGLREEVEQLRRSLDAYETGRAAGPQVAIEISASIVRDDDGDPCVFSAAVCDAVNAGMSEVDIIAALAGQGAPAALGPIVNGIAEQAQALDQITHILRHQRFSSGFQHHLDSWIVNHSERIRSFPTQPVRDALQTLRAASLALQDANPGLARKLDALQVQQPVLNASPGSIAERDAGDEVDQRYTRAPWSIGGVVGDNDELQINGPNGVCVGATWAMGEDFDAPAVDGLANARANADRIIACVTACEGVPTLALRGVRSPAELAGVAKDLPASPAVEAETEALVALAERAGFEFDEDEEQPGLWYWTSGDEGCPMSLDSKRLAALNALESRFKSDWQYEVENGDTRRGFVEWCEVQIEQLEDEPAGMTP